MSGISSNRNKKNQKKNKLGNVPHVIQVKSVKLEPNKISKSGKASARSENALKTCLKMSETLRTQPRSDQETNNGDTSTGLIDPTLVTKIQRLSIGNEGAPGSSRKEEKASHSDSEIPAGKDEENTNPFFLDYPDVVDPSENCDPYSYKYRAKSSKSIKFTDQVTVLYFNGEEVISEAIEPLKKEIEQQLRNKEMRKEHLNTKGYEVDNVYLF